MASPRIVAVAPGSPAARAGLQVGDEVITLNGQVPRDVIQWRLLADGAIDTLGSDHVAHTRTRESMETGNVWTTISGFPSRVTL